MKPAVGILVTDALITRPPGAVGNPATDEITSEDESADSNNGKNALPDSGILTFDDLKPDPKKRKSQLELLGIPKPERRELTEEEQKKADELASEFSSFLTPKKADEFWGGLDSGNAF